jgi:hypothetical protein
MSRYLRSYLNVLAGLLVAFLGIGAAQAQSFEAMMNGIIRGTPGITNVAINGGVRVGASGAVAVQAGGFSIPVATTVAADVGTTAVARAAGRVAMRAIPWVGTGLLVADIASVVSSSGYSTCPPPSFFCKKDPNGFAVTDTLSAYVQNQAKGACRSPSENCGYMAAAAAFCANYGRANWDGIVRPYASPPNPAYSTYYLQYQFYFTCFPSGDPLYTVAMAKATGCPAGYHVDTGQCVKDNAIAPTLPATLDEVNTAIAAKLNADSQATLRIKASMDAISQANPGVEPPLDVTTVPVTVTAPQTTGPAIQVSTKTIDNPDGTTSTEKITQQTIVTPVIQSGGTVANPNVSFPSQTVTTTSVTNNTTNVTNTTTTTIVNPTVVPKPAEKVDLPTDYNREVTQKAILQQLDGSTITVADPANQEDRTKTETAKTDKSLADKFSALPGEIATDKANWFSWVWTPPIGTCSSSMFTGTVRGYVVNWDICPWVDKIREVIGWLFALFAAMNIYSNLFRKESV